MTTAIQMRDLSGVSGGLSTGAGWHRFKYDVWDRNKVATLAQMRTHVLDTIAAEVDGCGLDDLAWEEDQDGTGHFIFTASYNSRRIESLLRIGWDSTGGTVRMTTSRATTRYARPEAVAPDFGNAIDCRDGEPQGVDVAVPALKLVFNYRWPKGVIDVAHVKDLAGMVGTTNDSTFHGFAAGELLFLGTSGEIDPTVPTEVQYHFAASANATLSIGSIASVAKQGHQYLWVLFEPAIDGDANALVRRPLACYVETVYGTSSFSAFGIGT